MIKVDGNAYATTFTPETQEDKEIIEKFFSLLSLKDWFPHQVIKREDNTLVVDHGM